MLKLTLNQRLLIAVLAALLPIAIFSIYQAVANSQYSRQLVSDRLAVSALAAASDQRLPLSSAQLTLATLIQNPDIYENGPNCVEIFKENLRAQSSLVNLIWSDNTGVPLCSVLPIPPGTSFASDEWWKRGVAGQRFVLSAPLISPISKRRVIIAMQPLFSSSGTHIGSLSAGIDLSWIERELRENDTSPTTLVGVADASGTMVMSSGPRRFQKISIEKSFGRAAAIESYDGEEWMYSSAPLYEKQLHVVYAEKANPLILPMRDQMRAGIAWPVLAILLTIAAVWIGINKIVMKWFREIGQMARQFARGDYAGRHASFAGAPPEIAEVGDDLHSMAQAIVRRNEELEHSLSATKAMAREVNHRVKNNLQMIMSLIALQAAQAKSDETRIVLDQTRGRMAALALVHRLLYENGDDADKGEVDMDRMTSEICQQLRISAALSQNVELHCHTNIGRRPVDEAVPVTLFIVEAVTNVFRHAFPDGQFGSVVVALSRSGDVITLEISDQGVGYDVNETPTSMGSELIRGFVEQLAGQLVVNAVPGKGVNMKLTYAASRIMQMAR